MNQLPKQSFVWSQQGTAALAALLMVAATVTTLQALGRSWRCDCHQALFWVGSIWNGHTSHHLADPYTFSHLQHGLLLYCLLATVAPRIAPAGRLLAAIAVECGWEILENTNWVIDKYRESTISLEYSGDTIVNSVADIGACAAGYGLAASLPVVASVSVAIAIEGIMLWSIRDNLSLNVLMLVHPFEAIKEWQLGG